ncbi:MAG: tetratricopeptide repeat protein [Verrucomicrobiota bacterium]
MLESRADDLSDRERKSFANAKLAIERGNFEYAVEICGSLLEYRPGCLDVRRVLRAAQQQVFARSGKGVGALICKAGNLAKAALGYGVIKKNPERAMVIGESILNTDPFNARGLSLVARGAEKLELFETEAFCLESICDRYPDNVDKLQRLCEALINVGHADDALRVAERLSALRPGNTRVQELVKSASVAHSIKRGKWANEEEDFRSKLKDQDEAESLERANRLNNEGAGMGAELEALSARTAMEPRNLDQYKLVIRSNLAKEDFGAAEEWLEKAFHLPRAEEDSALVQLKSELRIRQLEQELYDLRTEAKKRGSNDSDHRIELLDAELCGLKLEESRRLVDQFPNDYVQRFKFGELLLRNEDLDLAIQQFQFSQKSPSLKLKSLVFLGRCFIRKGLYDLAFEQLNLANDSLKSMDDFKKEVVYEIAECCERLGKREEAISHYKLIYANDIGFRDVARKIDSFYQ